MNNIFKVDASRNNNWFEDTKVLSPEDSELLEMVSSYMKGYFDLEDVRKDPDLADVKNITKEMINDYHSKIKRDKANETFIRESIAGPESDYRISEEIRNIKQDIKKNKLEGITAEWVEEWYEKRLKNSGRDEHTAEISDFVTSSLMDERIESEKELYRGRKRGLRRSLLRYISFSAAAIISLFILVRTLLPSYNSEKLFSTYYEPLNAISSITRNSNTNLFNSYLSAIDLYKLGDYQGAAIGFLDAIEDDNSAIEPQFFLGITELALGNINQAIDLLSVVSENSAGYSKEAVWYLGLAYLKTGEKEKALVCFELLTQTPSSYRERARKIVRNL